MIPLITIELPEYHELVKCRERLSKLQKDNMAEALTFIAGQIDLICKTLEENRDIKPAQLAEFIRGRHPDLAAKVLAK